MRRGAGVRKGPCPLGETTAGRATAGRATAGRATAGRATAGRATAGRATAGRATAGRATAGRATAGEGTAGEATAEKAIRERREGRKCVGSVVRSAASHEIRDHATSDLREVPGRIETLLRHVALLRAGTQIVAYFVERAARHSEVMQLLFRRAAAKALRNARRNGTRRAQELRLEVRGHTLELSCHLGDLTLQLLRGVIHTKFVGSSHSATSRARIPARHHFPA